MERPSIMTSYADLNETSSSLGAVLGIVLVCVNCFPDCGPLSTGSDARQQAVVLRTRRQRDYLWLRPFSVLQRWSFGPVEHFEICNRV